MTVSESIGGVRPVDQDVATVLGRGLVEIGVRHAFGVSGGGIGRIWRALIEEPGLTTLHFRHEAGAAFAATEASVGRDGPAAIFCTTGPGITNCLTGLVAARAEGARVVLVSPRTSPAQRGRGAVQETPMPSADLYSPGWLFDDVLCLDAVDQLPAALTRMRHGCQGPGAYLAHLSIPVSLQNAPVHDLPGPPAPYRLGRIPADPRLVDEVVDLMASRRFAIWVGHGARHASRQVRALARLSGVPVLATPRGKGVVPDDDAQLLMVTGLGGHPGQIAALEAFAPDFTLVLGTRLGEPSSGWDPALVPPGGLVHVDLDPSVPGRVYGGPLVAIAADVAAFLDQVIARADRIPHRGFSAPPPYRKAGGGNPGASPVAPQALMDAVQTEALDRGTTVLVEPGSAMAWASHLLVAREPGQIRIPGNFGSMGQMVCGVLGAGLAARRPALCVTGDGSLLMNNEISTAVQYGIPAVWVVVNNGRYQMCEMGMRFGPAELHARLPRTDFVQVARGMGACATAVGQEQELGPALRSALDSRRPWLIDVAADPGPIPPFESRFRTLR